MAFQFTQPKWAATSKRCFMLMRHVVSIHAAQVGCESHTVRRFTSPTRFNSRSPSGLRLGVPSMVYSKSWFQFTQPKRAATKATSTTPSRRPPFQFTQPKRAATIGACSLRGTRCVSIHAAQASCDLVLPRVPWFRWCFNSRSPSGLRLIKSNLPISGCRFNSRSPSGLRHPPRARRLPLRCFNSRSPSGLRRLLQRYNKKDILSKDKSRKSLLVIILDEEDKAIGLELTDNQALRNSNKIMFT